MDHGDTATLQQAGPVLVLALETVLLVPGDHRGLTPIMDLAVIRVLPLLHRLDTMDTDLVMVTVLVLAIMGFNHRDPRVRVCMALADLVVLPAMDLDLDLDLALDPVLMDSKHRGLPVRVCMGPDIRDMDRMGGDAEVEVCF